MSEFSQEMVDWMDEDGHVLASLPRSEIRRRNLLHRVTATLVFHPDGRLFVHQRHPGKDVYPGLNDLFVGGTVVSGESFPANACREIDEELGVRGVPIFPLFRHRFKDEYTHSDIQVFACVYAGPMRFQPEEVVGGRWMNEDEAMALAESGRACPDSKQGWRRFGEIHGKGRNFHSEIAPALAPVDCSPWREGG